MAPETRRRLARVLLVLFVMGGGVWLISGWHGRAMDIEIVHHLPGADALLPARVEIHVWEGETLHANATYFHPTTLEELPPQSVNVPTGEYRVTLAVFQEFRGVAARLERQLTVTEAGRYHLHYELPE